MANLKDVIYISNEDYDTLVSTGTVTIDGTTLTYDENCVYITPDKLASTTEDGLMSADDKNKLDSIENIIDDAYDSTHTYNTGNTCIYNNVLYKCNTDGTTGAWDSTKWDATTVAELISNETIITNAFIPYNENTSISSVLKNEIRINKAKRTLTVILECNITTTSNTTSFIVPQCFYDLGILPSSYNGIVSFIGTQWIATFLCMYFYRVSGGTYRCSFPSNLNNVNICINQTIKY